MFNVTYIFADGARVEYGCYHFGAAQAWFDTHRGAVQGFITDPETGEILYEMSR